MLARLHALRHGRHGDDEGFTLVELLVSLVVASIVMSGVAYGVAQALWQGRDSRNREVAANLAAEAIDRARATTDYTALAGQTSTQVVNGETYTVVRSVTAYSSLGTASPCDGTAGAFIKYKKVSVRVTWPRMKQGTASVRAETLLAPGASSFDPTKGNIGAKVLDAKGLPVEGIPVTVVGSVTRTQTTDDAGCAFFDGLTPGAFSVTANQSGYVTSAGVFVPTLPASVSQGNTTPVAFDYDRVGTLKLGLGDSSYPAPANVPVTIGNTSLLPDGHTSYAGTGTPRTLTNRFPFASGYTVWAGSCMDADPEGASTAGAYYPTATRGTAYQATTSGTPPTIAVAMAKVRIAVLDDATGSGIVGADVSAAHSGTAVCDFPESYSLGTSDGSGDLRVSLPWGSWDIAVAGRTVVGSPTWVLEPSTSEIYVEVRVA
ncbi:MAG: carboxypeptidase-like regulatory domain-containing protein [Actinobacteria bacterium]|nr:carboxypeptidase-like regulatory domain-containing protein [Actinomycetota bacterium]